MYTIEFDVNIFRNMHTCMKLLNIYQYCETSKPECYTQIIIANLTESVTKSRSEPLIWSIK